VVFLIDEVADQESGEVFELLVMHTYPVEHSGLLSDLVAEKVITSLISSSQDPEEEVPAGTEWFDRVYELLSAPAHDRIDYPPAWGEDVHLHASI